MHEYDTVLKSLLTDFENSLFERITGAKRGRWLNVELPKVAQPRVDLLFETSETPNAANRLIALELQSTNDPKLPVRMAEYSLAIYRLHERFPEQHVLYVGSDPLRMPASLVAPNHICRYNLVDIRDLDAEAFLDSPFPADTVLAILGRYSNKMETIRQILSRIAKLEQGAAEAAFSRLLILAGLRQLEETVRKEVKHMPILDDIMNHDVIGPAIRQGLEKGRHEEAVKMMRRLITDRFGPPPTAIDARLGEMSVAELEDLGSRLLRATSLGDLF